MKTILVTGSGGFIGGHLVEQLGKEYRVVPFDKVIGLDIRSKGDLAKVFSIYKIDCVVHLAALAGVRPSIEDPLPYLETNVTGTMNLLEAMKVYNCKKIVFASSSSVYGNNFSEEPSKEEDEKSPISPYAYTKATTEDLLKLYNKIFKIDSISTRFFTVYGPNQRKDLAISKFIRAIKEGSEITVYGDGNQRRDFTFISDIVDGIEKSVKKVLESEICECINLCSGNAVSVNEVIEKLFKITGKRVSVVHEEEKLGDVNLTYGNNERARLLLNWKPEVSIEEGLRQQFSKEGE